MSKIKTPKSSPSYATLHNRAVNTYKKCSLFLLWAGVLGVFSTLAGMIQLFSNKMLTLNGVTYTWPTTGFSLAFSTEILFAKLLINIVPSTVLAAIIVFVISLFIGGVFAYLGIFAQKGRIIFLYIGGAIYLVDSLMTIPAYIILNGEYRFLTLLFTILAHIIILVAIIIAIIEYYNVFRIEKKFKGEVVFNEREVIAHGE